MVEKQIDKELVAAANFHSVLPPDECETGTKFEQEASDVASKHLFDIALLCIFGKPQKVENVWVLQRPRARSN